jgi:flagellar protein FlaI
MTQEGNLQPVGDDTVGAASGSGTTTETDQEEEREDTTETHMTDTTDHETVIPAIRLIDEPEAGDEEPTGGGAGGGPAAGAPDDDDSDEQTPSRPSTNPIRDAVLTDVKAYFAAHEGEFAEAPDEAFLEEQFFDFSYLDQYREVERYWVHEPYAYITVLYDEDEKEYSYHVIEPTLDRFEQYVRQDLITLLRNRLMYIDIDEDDDRAEVFIERAKEIIDEHAATVETGTLHKLLYYLLRDFIHFGPIDPIMRDRNIEDVSCDGIDVPVFVYHREYRDLRTNITFSKRALNSFTVRLAQRSGKQISVSDPLVDASLPDGSRIQLTLGGEVSTRGSNFTIRKFADIPYTPVDLVGWNTFSLEQMAYFWLAIENNKSLIFAGGTGSGKTTSMNAVSFFIPPASKVVTIEDTREIDLPHENWIQSVTRSSASGEGRGEVTMYNLLQAALRQRPEYILVGEIRTEQKVALTFFQAMGTGHTAYTTVHADSVDTVISRLQNPPLNVPTQMLQDLDIVSIQRQTFIGDRRVRRNMSVWELDVDEDNTNLIQTNGVFEWNAANDDHMRVGDSKVLTDIARERGWDEEELDRQFDGRRRVLEYMREHDIVDYYDVSATIHMFSKDPDYVLDQIDSGELDPETIQENISGRSGDVAASQHDDAVGGDESADLDDAEVWEDVVKQAREEAEAHVRSTSETETDGERDDDSEGDESFDFSGEER